MLDREPGVAWCAIVIWPSFFGGVSLDSDRRAAASGRRRRQSGQDDARQTLLQPDAPHPVGERNERGDAERDEDGHDAERGRNESHLAEKERAGGNEKGVAHPPEMARDARGAGAVASGELTDVAEEGEE